MIRLYCAIFGHHNMPIGRYSAYGYSVVLRCQRCGHERAVS